MKKQRFLSLAFSAAASLSLAVSSSSCGARIIGVKLKGAVTPISVSWDTAFIGHFEPQSREDVASLLSEDIPQDAKDELIRSLGKTAVAKIESYKALLRALSSKDKRVLLDAIFKAGEFYFPSDMESHKKVVVDALMNYLKTSDDYQIRSHALLSLTKLHVPAVEEAHTLLFSKHNVERYVSAYHLKVLGKVDSLPVLARALSLERQPTVKRMIESAIEAIEDRAAALSVLPEELPTD